MVAHIYSVRPPDLVKMTPADSHAYSNALATWVAEHPFLNGNRASSAVFEAVITSKALRHHPSAEIAARNELFRGSAANPFLSEFYLPDELQDNDHYEVPAEHIGILYASLRARLALGDRASLLIEGSEDAEEEDALEAEVEITIARRNAERARTLRFYTQQTGTLRLGNYVQDVDLTVPYSRVEIGPGSQAVLVAPVSIQGQKLTITVNELIVESPPGHSDGAVYLESETFEGDGMTSVPVVRGTASLACAWPNARTHPWTNFATTPTQNEDPRLDEALRRFRKFVTAFRSHSKGSLARYQDKLEHARMTKGTGRDVLDLMVRDGILSLQDSMYYLDPDRLGAQTGATYADCMARRFGPTTIAFIRRAL